MPPSLQNVSSFPVRSGIVVAVLGVIAVLAAALWQQDQPRRRADESDETGKRDQGVAREEPEVSAAPAAATPHYVDDARCAECHDQIYATYREHPMGRSMGPVGEVRRIAEAAESDQGFVAGRLRYDVVHRGGALRHVETYLDEDGDPIAANDLPVAYAVGSGERGRSYLVDRDGRLYLSPITWYSQKGRWDLSPGYEDHNSHFNRPVIVQCLFCHANRTHPVHGTLNSYEQPIFSGHAIGCQRCHGPGEAHIALQEGAAAVDAEETIINPARLEPKLRDAVCEQCHLSGAAKVVRRGKDLYDFRPGMPLEDVVRIFVDGHGEEETAKFVGHVEQMHASRCFEKSDGRMGCITCHDPHASPAKDIRVTFYRSRCLTCHGEQDCTETPQRRQAAGDDNCMQCHMPAQQTEIRHAAMTDHRILRRPEEKAQAASGVPSAGRASLVPFHAGSDEELGRDSALAVLRVDGTEDVPLPESLLKQAALDLQAAVRRHPDDLDALEGFGLATWRLGNAAFALRCFESVLSREPRREFALSSAATLSARLGRHDRALRYWQQSVGVNPWMVRNRAELAAALASLGRWPECETACRETLEHFPGSHRSHQLLIEALLAQGQEAEAEGEFEAWVRFRPTDPEKLRTWFRNHPLRSSK